LVPNNTKIILHGHNENTTHTINEDEKESFAIHINQQLSLDIDPKSMELFTRCSDGLILAKLINDSVPGTIDERVLNTRNLNTWQITENNNLVINSAKAIGCSVVNIGSSDIIKGTEHLLLGLIWQIIKIGLQSFIDIKHHPELFRLLFPGELLEDFLKLPSEQILLRWFNYHLKKAGHHKNVSNFTTDLKVFTL
jgi:plastin-1